MPDHKKSTRKPGILAKLRNIFGLNIGTAMFGALFLYMVFGAVLYLTSQHIESYQVTSGPLSKNETYTGLALMEESVIKADSSGYVTYYAREGSKINANGAVYGISSTKSSDSQAELSKEELNSIRSDMLSFSRSFDPSKFNNTYSFKYELNGNILQYASDPSQSSALTDSGDTTVSTSGQNISRASTDGIILYSRDGYEGKNADNVTVDDFDQNSYQETDLKTSGQISTGDDVYTIITDERWSLLIPLSDKQAARLKDRTSIRVKFLKDDMTQTGDFSIMEIDGTKYGKIDFNKGLIRYASERFLDIELVTNTVTGLKIPLSSVVTKDFYVVPSRFLTRDSQSGSSGFMLAGKNKKGKTTSTFVSVSISISEEDPDAGTDENGNPYYLYYIDKSKFNEGDALTDPSSGERYIIGETKTLDGVYCINQGYAVFRRIDILDQNEEYAIVSRETTSGLARYDRIVRNADKVSEQDILY
nr:HlyD family efflux transporter periplasmic adaptor subunit [uncultured Blautia sp.]